MQYYDKGTQNSYTVNYARLKNKNRDTYIL